LPAIANLAGVADDEGLEKLRVVEIGARRHHPLAEGWVVEQQSRQFVRQLREEIGYRVLVEPQPGRRDQAEALNLARRHRRHLGRNHSAQRMAHEDRPIEPECLQHVERMQGNVEHLAQALGPFGIAVARQERRIQMPAPGECREKRVVLSDPAGPVQEDQRPALARLEHPDLAAASRDIEQVRASPHVAASVAIARGTTRCESGWIQKRSSLS
jgi:hypothetical protein